MIDKLKENWFVVLVAILLFGACGFYAYDTNKGKLPGKTVNGKDVVAAIGDKNIFADDMYADLYGNPESSTSQGAKLLYMHFERAVAEEGVPMTDDLKAEIAMQVAGFKQSFQSYYGDRWQEALLYALQSAGYSSIDDLEAYFTHYLKLQTLKHENYEQNIDELFSKIYEEKKPRTVSHILVKMEDPENPTEAEQKKMDDIDAALAQGKDFAEVAKEFSDDTSKSEGGFLGYADSDTQFVTEFKDAMLAQEKGVVGEWVQTQFGKHKILVNETEKDALMNDESLKTSIYKAIDTTYPERSIQIVWDKAQELGITFDDPTLEKVLKEYMGITE